MLVTKKIIICDNKYLVLHWKDFLQEFYTLATTIPFTTFPLYLLPNSKYRHIMDKVKLTWQDLSRVFESRLGRVCIGHELYTFCKTA